MNRVTRTMWGVAASLVAAVSALADSPNLSLQINTNSSGVNQAQNFFQVTNNGTTSVKLSDISIKFWVNDTTGQNLVPHIYTGGCVAVAGNPSCIHQVSGVTAKAGKLSSACGTDPVRQANWSVTVSNTDGSMLAPGATWSNLQSQVNLANYANFNPGQASWYSPYLSPASYVPDVHFAVYVSGKPVTGSPPLRITKFNIPTVGAGASHMAAGPDGNVWFTEGAASKIGRITPSGVITEFTPPGFIYLNGITSGPDGNLWFVGSNGIGRITPSGVITTYPYPGYSEAQRITSGPDGNLWFTESHSVVGRITPSGVATEFTLPGASGAVWPMDITAGPDGNLWFTEANVNKIGRITPSGAITEFAVPTSSLGPLMIASGNDGNLWFTEPWANKIGRITPAGAISEFGLNAGPNFISAGPDGALWFSEPYESKIGRITTSGVVTEIPTSSLIYDLGEVTDGPDGNMWFPEYNGNKIGKISLSGCE